MSTRPPSVQHEPAPAGSTIAIVRSRFNEEITSLLLESCEKGLASRGVELTAITVSEVPGAFELPFAALQLASGGEFDAVICLGAVIRGDTPHFDYVCQAAADGILRAGMDTGVPVIFGVLTVDSWDQAKARVGADAPAGDKGYEAAMSAVDMLLWQAEFVSHG